MYIKTACYVYIVATCIALSEYFADTKICFTEVHNAFAFQTLLTCRSHLIRFKKAMSFL